VRRQPVRARARKALCPSHQHLIWMQRRRGASAHRSRMRPLQLRRKSASVTVPLLPLPASLRALLPSVLVASALPRPRAVWTSMRKLAASCARQVTGHLHIWRECASCSLNPPRLSLLLSTRCRARIMTTRFFCVMSATKAFTSSACRRRWQPSQPQTGQQQAAGELESAAVSRSAIQSLAQLRLFVSRASGFARLARLRR